MKEKLNPTQSEIIDSLRFPVIILVLYAHMLPIEGRPIEFNFSGLNIYHYISELISHLLGAIPTSFFFFISGFFFVKGMAQWDQGSYYMKLKKRVKTLLVPYLAWIILLVIITISKSTLINMIWPGRDMDFSALKQTSLYHIFWGGPLLYPFWFLRDLICMTLLTPLFYYFGKYTKIYGILFLMILYLLAIESGIPGFSTKAIFYYASGVYIGMNHINLLEMCNKYKRVSVIAALLIMIIATFFSGTSYHGHLVRLFCLIGIVALINIFSTLLRNQFIKNILIRLSVTSFFVYALHQIYIIGWLKGAFSRTPWAENPGAMMIAYFIIPCICASICVGIYALLHKIFPSFLALLCGGRTHPILPVKDKQDMR